MGYYPINQGIQIVFDLYALFSCCIGFRINFWRYHFCPSEWLLYHFLYHFGIEIRRYPWEFIEKRFFSISKKALHCEDLLSYMSLYWENETRSICYDTKFHFIYFSFKFPCIYKGFCVWRECLYAIFTPFHYINI